MPQIPRQWKCCLETLSRRDSLEASHHWLCDAIVNTYNEMSWAEMYGRSTVLWRCFRDEQECYRSADSVSGGSQECSVCTLSRPSFKFSDCWRSHVARGVQSAGEFFSLVEMLYVFVTRQKVHEVIVCIQKERGFIVRELGRLRDIRWACRYMNIAVIVERYDIWT